MTAMLDATLERWRRENVAEGVRRGMERGLAQGVERGLAQGVERGVAQGVERGLAQGRVALLRRQAERKFGVGVARQVATLLADVSDMSRLDEAGDWMMDCDTGEMLLARLRTHPPASGNGAAE